METFLSFGIRQECRVAQDEVLRSEESVFIIKDVKNDDVGNPSVLIARIIAEKRDGVAKARFMSCQDGTLFDVEALAYELPSSSSFPSLSYQAASQATWGKWRHT